MHMFRCQTCAGWWSKFIRALPPDPLNQDFEGAWHFAGQRSKEERLLKKQKIDHAIRAGCTLGLQPEVANAIGCKWHEEKKNGKWQVGAISPDDRGQNHICGGLICGPFYHGKQCGSALKKCHNCYVLERIDRPLCNCCSYDDGKLHHGFTLCLPDHCPALGRRNDKTSTWHSRYFEKNESGAEAWMASKPWGHTLEERLRYMKEEHPELTRDFLWNYRNECMKVGFGVRYVRNEPSRGYAQGKSMYEKASRVHSA